MRDFGALRSPSLLLLGRLCRLSFYSVMARMPRSCLSCACLRLILPSFLVSLCIPELFSGRWTLGEIFGSSPQKHSGTFPNVFRRGRLWGKFSEAVPKNTRERSWMFFRRGRLWGKISEAVPKITLGNVPEFFFGEADFRWNPRKQSPK